MSVLAIDPGNTHSAYVYIGDNYRPRWFAKLPNADLLIAMRHGTIMFSDDHAVIEMVASYGMAVGADVFETCVWIGRFHEAIASRSPHDPELVYRRDIKLHHCHNGQAGDSNIRQALIDRFAPGVRNHGKGTKNEPGWFHGFHSDIWQAYALAVYTADQLAEAVA